MIVLARQTDPELREIRKWREDNVESVDKANGALIAKAYFAIKGKDTLSRRDLHAAAGLRAGEGLRRERQAGPLPDDLGRHVRALARSTAASRRTTCRRATSTRRSKVDPKTPVNFVYDGRHDRRQLRKPGRQPEGGAHRAALRRQHPVARQRRRVHGGRGALGLRPHGRDDGDAAQVYDAGAVADELEKPAEPPASRPSERRRPKPSAEEGAAGGSLSPRSRGSRQRPPLFGLGREACTRSRVEPVVRPRCRGDSASAE